VVYARLHKKEIFNKYRGNMAVLNDKIKKINRLRCEIKTYIDQT